MVCFRVFSWHLSGGNDETHLDSLFPGRDSNQIISEYKAEVVSA
jgi:hypothetical protein